MSAQQPTLQRRALLAAIATTAVAALLPVYAQAQTAAPAQVPSPAPAATLVPGQSQIAFTTRQLGVPVEGRFGRFTLQIALDPKKPESGQLRLTIDVASARFGTAELDGEVGKPRWLAAAKFPQAVFQSTAVRPAAGGTRFEVAGRLTLKGTTREVVVPVALAQSGGQTTASGSFTIKRLDYSVGEGEWADTSLLSNDVAVRFKLVLAGMAPL
ncbi:MAG: YceI family protein [Burkholderiales bacterium]|nr:YceI family protein [Burkholderiales bacterium]